MTVGRVLVRGKDEGTGFVIATGSGPSGGVALTARHVLHGRDASAIQFVTPTGRTIPVERIASDEDIDVAVLYLQEDVDGLVAAHARERLAWQVDARPRSNDPRLTGTVTDTQRQFSKAGRPDISILQLHVNEGLGEYEGYSGSPVVLEMTDAAIDSSGNSGHLPVLGVLIEQVRGRFPVRRGQPKAPASNVLYAIPIQDVLARFGLDAVWVSAGEIPLGTEVVPRYLDALAARREERFDPNPHIALGLRRGGRAPTPVTPAALRRDREKLRALLKPRLSPDSSEHAPDEGRPIADLVEFQERHTRVVLLGRPGAGKSTTLRNVVDRLGAPWSSREATGDTTKIPIFADLSEWADDSIDLPTFLQSQLRSLGQGALAASLPDLMRRGRVVLLLDGLNEMPRLRRDPITDHVDDPRVGAVADLGRRADWKDVGCVLSCRSRDFSGGPAWHDLHILDLDSDRVAEFARAYFSGEPDASTVTTAFLRDLYRSGSSRVARLRELVTNPFFLTKLLAYYSELGQEIPDRLTDLLKFYVDEVLERERVDDRADELRRQLGVLAFRMTENGQFGPVDHAQAAAWLAPDDGAPVDLVTAGAAWRAADGASLMITSEGEVRFAHQLIQEFFAATFLHDRSLTAELLGAVAQPQFNEIWPLWADLDPAVVDRLVPFLGDAAAGVRRAAATVLGPLRDRRAAGPLARLLADTDDAVSWSAALSLAALDDHRATPVLVERLHAVESGVRQVAAHTLGVLGDPRAVDPLVDVLRHDASTGVRAFAATALGRSADERAIRPLVEALVRSGDGEVSRAAARALGRLRDPRAVPDLLAQLGNAEIEPGAIAGLRAMGEVALEPLVDLLRHDRNAKRRERAAFVLGLSHRPGVVPALIAALSDQEPRVKETSARALGRFGEHALAPLLEVLDDGDEDAQGWALFALGLMADTRAVPHLLKALQSESEQLVGWAAHSLRQYGEGAVVPLLGILLDRVVDPQTRWHAALAMGGLGQPAVTALVDAARSEDSDLAMFAVEGLAEAVDRWSLFDPLDPRVAETLAEAIYNTDRVVRRTAALALGRAGDARAVPALTTMIRSDEPDLRAAALDQLGRVEHPSAVDVLVSALHDADAATRRAACETLSRLLDSSRSVRNVIDAALDTSLSSPRLETRPRTALVELLRTWRDPQVVPALVPALRRAVLPLIAALRDSDSDVVSEAITALKNAAEPLADLSLVLPDWRNRRGGAVDSDDEVTELHALVRETLVPLAHPEAVSALVAVLSLLDDESDDQWRPLRSSIASLLGAVGDQEVVSALAELLKSTQNEVVTEASDALVRLGGPAAQSALIVALNSRTGPSRERFTLMWDVLELADSRTVGILLDALRDPAPHDDEALVELLRALGELALVPLITALGDPDLRVAGTAARALDPDDQGIFAATHRERRWRLAKDALDRLSDSDVEALVVATRHDDEQVMRIAIAWLEKLDHPAARAALDTTARTESPEQPPPGIDELVADLAADDPETRAEAARALGLRGDRSTLRSLTALLTDDAPVARAAGAFALGRLGDRSVMEHVGALLSDPSDWVVENAVYALGRLGGGDALHLVLESLLSDRTRAAAARALELVDEQTLQANAAQIVNAVLTSIRQEPRFQHSSHDYAVYSAALGILPKLGDQAVTLLLMALDDGHDAVRNVAAKALAAAADIRALPLLQWMAEHDKGDYVIGGSKLKDVAAVALQDIQIAHRAREPLIETMASRDRLTRYGAAFLLAYRDWRGATATLIDGLQDSDLRVRWGAAHWLGVLGDGRAIESLVATLGDRDGSVRENATGALVRLGPVVVPPVIAALDESDPDIRAQAAVVLGYCGSAEEIEWVIAALGDPAVAVCTAAATALGMLADRGLLEDVDTGELDAALNTALRTVEQSGTGDFDHLPIVEAFAKFDEARVVEVLIEALGSRHRFFRLTAVQRLGKLGDPRAIAPLNMALSDEYWLVREDTAYALKKFADVSSVEPLIALLSLGASFERLAAIDALVAIEDSRAAVPLVDLLRNESPDVCSAAADAIVTLADDAAIQLLVVRLGEEPPERYGYADDSAEEPPALGVLVRIGARAAGPILDALAGSDPDVAVYWATEALRRMGAEAVPALVDGLGLPEEGSRAEICALCLADLGDPGRSALATALAHERAEARAGAAYGLGHTGDDAAIPPLVGALQDVVADVRGIAAMALGRFFERTELIEPLAAALGDPEEGVRVCAAAALAQLGDERGAETLVAALMSDDVGMACFAATINGEHGPIVGVEPLITALQSGSAELRATCAAALWNLGDPRALPALDRAADDASQLPDGRTVGAVAAEAARQIRAFIDWDSDGGRSTSQDEQEDLR